MEKLWLSKQVPVFVAINVTRNPYRWLAMTIICHFRRITIQNTQSSFNYWHFAVQICSKDIEQKLDFFFTRIVYRTSWLSLCSDRASSFEAYEQEAINHEQRRIPVGKRIIQASNIFHSLRKQLDFPHVEALILHCQHLLKGTWTVLESITVSERHRMNNGG